MTSRQPETVKVLLISCRFMMGLKTI